MIQPIDDSMTSVAEGDYVICTEDCSLGDHYKHYEFCPQKGEAFRVAGLMQLPGRSFTNLILLGIERVDGSIMDVGYPGSHFRRCTEEESREGRRKFQTRLDYGRLCHFKKLQNKGVTFVEMPDYLREWWLNRY